MRDAFYEVYKCMKDMIEDPKLKNYDKNFQRMCKDLRPVQDKLEKAKPEYLKRYNKEKESMQIVNVERGDLEQLIEKLPEDLKEEFQKILSRKKQIEPIEYLKIFVENYDKDCAIEDLLCKITVQTLMHGDKVIKALMRERDKQGIDHITSLEAVRELADVLEKNAKGMRGAADDIENSEAEENGK